MTGESFPQPSTQCERVDAEFDRQFGDPIRTLSADARLHLAACERCRALYRYLSTPEPLPAVSPALKRQVAQRLQSSLGREKPVGSIVGIAAALFLMFVFLSLSAAAILKADGLRIMTAVQLSGIAVALLAGAVLLSLSLAARMIPGSVRRVSAKAAVAIPAAAFLLAVALLFPWRSSPAFFAEGRHCLGLGSAIALPCAVLFFLAVRRGAPPKPVAAYAVAGAIAGLVAVAALQSNCEMQEASHLIVWHGGVLLAFTLAGLLLGRAQAY